MNKTKTIKTEAFFTGNIRREQKDDGDSRVITATQ